MYARTGSRTSQGRAIPRFSGFNFKLRGYAANRDPDVPFRGRIEAVTRTGVPCFLIPAEWGKRVFRQPEAPAGSPFPSQIGNGGNGKWGFRGLTRSKWAKRGLYCD